MVLQKWQAKTQGAFLIKLFKSGKVDPENTSDEYIREVCKQHNHHALCRLHRTIRPSLSKKEGASLH